MSCIQVSHNMVQFIILNFNSFSIFSGQITVRHLIQNHSMRIICKIQSAAIQSCSCHKIRNRSVYFCCQLQFFSCQICIDKRISCHTVFSNSQRKRIVNILYCNIAFCICVTDRSAWHNRYIYRIPIVILWISHSIYIRIRHNIAKIQFFMLCSHLFQTVKFNIVLSQNFIPGVPKICKIIGVYCIH